MKSPQAKNKINQWFKKEFKEENIIRGKDLITAYCKSKSINLADILKPKYQQIVQKKYGFRDWDAVLAAIGHGGLKEGQVVNRLLEEYEKEHKKEITDETILEKISEANSQKVHIAKSRRRSQTRRSWRRSPRRTARRCTSPSQRAALW